MDRQFGFQTVLRAFINQVRQVGGGNLHFFDTSYGAGGETEGGWVIKSLNPRDVTNKNSH